LLGANNGPAENGPCCRGERASPLIRSRSDRSRLTQTERRPIAEPMTLANMRQNGARSLAVQCHQCRHEVIMNVDHLAGDVTVPSFGPRMVCTKCGTIGADVRPNWDERDHQ
jgi:hypothetical protein